MDLAMLLTAIQVNPSLQSVPFERLLLFLASVTETTQKPVKGALGNQRSKCTDQRLALGRSVQVVLME